MSECFLSLREMGRRLGIPPSTVVYYKDKYGKFLPDSGGTSVRKKYPAETLEIVRRIREMSVANWSTEQIEQELYLKFGTIIDSLNNKKQFFDQSDQRVESPNSLDDVVGSFSEAVSKISEILLNQSLYQAELGDLRREIKSLRNENKESQLRFKSEILDLKTTLASALQVNEELRRAVEKLQRSNFEDAFVFPTEDYLNRAMVVKSSGGDYLGVSGKDSPFSLKDFVQLLENSVTTSFDVSLKWVAVDEHSWKLLISPSDNDESKKKIELSTKQIVTPNGNTVVQIISMKLNNKPVPDSLLFSLLKDIKRSFDM